MDEDIDEEEDSEDSEEDDCVRYIIRGNIIRHFCAHVMIPPPTSPLKYLLLWSAAPLVDE